MGRRPAISEIPARHPANWMLVSVGVLVLLLGASVYMLDRPPESAPFLAAVNISHLLPSFFIPLGDNLPAFAHAFAFSLLTAVCLGGGSGAALWACLTWIGIDAAFEAGQHPQIAERIVRVIPDWFETLPILEHADDYFLAGTFDVSDLVSIALGAIAAFILNADIRYWSIHDG